MSVSSELLCSFELLKPLDSSALKSHIKKGRNKRNNMLNSPVSHPVLCGTKTSDSNYLPACDGFCSEFLMEISRYVGRKASFDCQYSTLRMLQSDKK